MTRDDILRNISSIDRLHGALLAPGWRRDRLTSILDKNFNLSHGERTFLEKGGVPVPGDMRIASYQWDAYDGPIQEAVRTYNAHIKAQPALAGYPGLDWVHVKSMIWTESGVPHPDWRRLPIQIGKWPADPGMDTVIHKREHISKVVPPQYQSQFTAHNITSDPIVNIRAGIGYLLNRLLRSADATGKNLSWRDFTFESYASRYNSNSNSGDHFYAQKLHYCHALIRLRSRIL